jgi:hypothetical protein
MDKSLMTPKEAALMVSSEIDTRVFTWTFDSLDKDHELERFFSGLPGFYNSKVLKEPLHGLDNQQKLRLLEAVIRLLDRTFSSNLLPDRVKRQRADICVNAINLVDTPNSFPEIIRRLVSENGYRPLQSFKIVDFVRRWGDRKLDPKCEYSTLDQAIFSVVVARVQQHDDAWFNLASDQISIPETVLRSHAAHGDSLSFAILIYVTLQQLSHIEDASWPSYAIQDVLEAASKFNVQDTSPELQHEFCALWNQIVLKAQNDNDQPTAWYILRPIHHIYIALHHGTNSAPTHFSVSTHKWDKVFKVPSSYPMCNVAGHVDDSASTSFARTLLRITTALVPVSLAGPDALPSPVPSSPVPVTIDVIESPTDPPSLENFHPAQTTIEGLRVPVPSADLATTSVIRDFDASSIRTLHSASDTSTLAPFPPATLPLPLPSSTTYTP